MPFNVKLPDGRILENVPDGTTKEQIAAKLGFKTSSMLESGVRGIGQGATLNLSDEIQAGIGAITAAPFVKDRTIGQLYDEGLKSQRQKENIARETNPITYGASEIAGSIPTSAKIIGALPAGITMAKTAGESALKAGGIGAGLGGAYGFGGGEGVENRLTNAGIGAGVGALTGGLLDYGISKATGRYNPAKGETIYSQENVLPLTKGQQTGDNELLTKEADLIRSGTQGGQELQQFQNEVQKPAAIEYIKKTFNVKEGEPSYQALINDVVEQVQTKGGALKQNAINLRNKAETLQTTVPKRYTDDIVADIQKEMYKFNVSDANKTLANVRKNVNSNSGNSGGGDINIADTSLQNMAYGTRKPETIDIKNIFNARKALSSQAKSLGSDAAAAMKANEIIDNKLTQFIDDGIINGDTTSIEAFKKSVPAFRKYYQTYEQSPSNVFNDIITNPQKYSPDELFNATFGKTLGGSQKGRLFVEQIKATLGDEGVQKLQQGFADSLIKKSSNDLGDVALGAMKRNLSNFLSNKSFAESIMTPEQLSSLKLLQSDLAKATRTPQLYKDSGTAYNLARIIKGGVSSGDRTGILSYIIDRLQNAKIQKESLLQAQKAITNVPEPIAQPVLGGIPQKLNQPLQIPIYNNPQGKVPSPMQQYMRGQ